MHSIVLLYYICVAVGEISEIIQELTSRTFLYIKIMDIFMLSMSPVLDVILLADGYPGIFSEGNCTRHIFSQLLKCLHSHCLISLNISKICKVIV